MRYYWQSGDVGPEYCKACRKARKTESDCDACPRPELLPENVQAIELFSAVQTQWQRRERDVLEGFNYAGVKAAADMLQMKEIKPTFEKLRIMEKEVLTIQAEKLQEAVENA